MGLVREEGEYDWGWVPEAFRDLAVGKGLIPAVDMPKLFFEFFDLLCLDSALRLYDD